MRSAFLFCKNLCATEKPPLTPNELSSAARKDMLCAAGIPRGRGMGLFIFSSCPV